MTTPGIVILGAAKNPHVALYKCRYNEGTDCPMQQNTSIYRITWQDVPTMYFIGVTTGQSTMTRLFPHWAAILDLKDARLIGVDLPLQASVEQYRQAVAQIKYDPLSMGALITTHKIDLAQAAGDMFDEFDLYARFCHEVSCISKR